MKTRQVERAEFRAQIKRGRSTAKRTRRDKAGIELERRKAAVSPLRIAAMSAVSKLSRAT